MRRWLRGESGQAIVLVGLGMVGLLAGAGLAIDASLLFVERRHGQVAADAAAYAAAVEMAKHYTAADRATRGRDAALAYAASNGFDNNGTTNTVTVNVPPLTGAFAGNSAYAEVTITAVVRTPFMRVLGTSFEKRDVSARAVGGVPAPAKSYSLIALNKTACASVEVDGNSEIETDDAGILVNSSCSTALKATGNAKIEADEGGIDVVGGVSATGGTEIRPAATTGAAQQSDPLAYLVRPALAPAGSIVENPPPAGCSSAGGAYPAIVSTGGTCTLNPGTYTSIRVDGTGKVKLKPGTYIIKGGGISVSGSGRLEDETAGDNKGVFIFNACSDFPATTGLCGGISTSGNGRFEIEKEGSGTYAGMSIWQPCENTQTMSVTGNSSHGASHDFETSGTIYLPCAALAVFGNGKLEIDNGQIVADTVSVKGNAELESKWEVSAKNVVRVPVLVE